MPALRKTRKVHTLHGENHPCINHSGEDATRSVVSSATIAFSVSPPRENDQRSVSTTIAFPRVYMFSLASLQTCKGPHGCSASRMGLGARPRLMHKSVARQYVPKRSLYRGLACRGPVEANDAGVTSARFRYSRYHRQDRSAQTVGETVAAPRRPLSVGEPSRDDPRTSNRRH